MNNIRSLKKKNPELKVFFLSDMYLTTENIEYLLKETGLYDIFDGGISSSDVSLGKHSGKLYQYAHNCNDKRLQDIDIYSNLHIGDSDHSDVKMAEVSGSFAFHYKPIRFRRLRTLWGRLIVKNKSIAAYKTATSLIDDYKAIGESNRSIIQNWAMLMSQAILPFLEHVGMQAHPKMRGDRKFMFVSSEATVFFNIGQMAFPHLFKSGRFIIANKLNRKCVIKAFVYYLIKNPQYNINAISEIIRYGEVKDGRLELYQFIFGKDHPVSEMVLNLRSGYDFWKALLNDIKVAPKEVTSELEKSYNYIKKIVPEDKNTRLVIVDIGWGGTVQTILSELMNCMGYKNRAEGLYLGRHSFDRFCVNSPKAVGYLMPDVFSKKYHCIWNAVLWEYVFTNKPQYPEDPAILKEVAVGIERGVDLYKNVQIAPKVYFDKVVYGQLVDLLVKPTRRQIEVLGNIKFDSGFIDKEILKICDLHLGKRGMMFGLFIRPKTVLKMITAPNRWTAAYIRYYHIIGAKMILKIAGKIKRHNFI